MFELKTITECKLTGFVGRTQKEGKDDIPAVSFRLALDSVPNDWLDRFSPTLRTTIYKAVEGQEQLPGVEVSTPLLRSKDVTHLAAEFRYEGWKVWVARGMDDDALQMERCKVDDFNFTFHEGGNVDFDFRVSTADVDEEGAGMLWSRQKRKVFVRIEAPEIPKGERTEATGAEIDGTTGHPGAADDAQGSLLDTEAQTPLDALEAAVGGPEGEGGAEDEPESEGGQTDDVEQFAAGAAEAVNKARGSRRARAH